VRQGEVQVDRYSELLRGTLRIELANEVDVTGQRSMLILFLFFFSLSWGNFQKPL
jgi:hypothetical protein